MATYVPPGGQFMQGGRTAVDGQPRPNHSSSLGGGPSSRANDYDGRPRGRVARRSSARSRRHPDACDDTVSLADPVGAPPPD
jgi:hypothetical protein